jgi:hypothetical protein
MIIEQDDRDTSDRSSRSVPCLHRNEHALSRSPGLSFAVEDPAFSARA